MNIIADPAWDRGRFEVVPQWCREMPEIVNISLRMPYPGTEIWRSESQGLTTRDYRLFDIRHAVFPTTRPSHEFYGELVKTQRVFNRKHLEWEALWDTRLLLPGQTNWFSPADVGP